VGGAILARVARQRVAALLMATTISCAAASPRAPIESSTSGASAAATTAKRAPRAPASEAPGGLSTLGDVGKSEGVCRCGDPRLEQPGQPWIRQEALQVEGAFPRELIARSVRERLGELRACYEQGLGRDPSLRGRVVTAFTIAASGGVVGSHEAPGTTLPDPQVARCVAHELGALSFPARESASVVVTCPLLFLPP
jgi:hypothetical protein